MNRVHLAILTIDEGQEAQLSKEEIKVTISLSLSVSLSLD
jgi:hypothetical protein